jgi:hypothetical protein
MILKFNEKAGFHKNEIEKPVNLNLLKQSLKEILGVEIGIVCTIEENKKMPEYSEKTFSSEGAPFQEGDASLSKETGSPSPDLANRDLIQLVQDDFGAEIIEETNLNEE